MELVEVKRKEIYCDSSIVAKKFGMKHNKVIRSIINVISKGYTVYTLKKEILKYRDQKYVVYNITPEVFIPLILSLKNKEVVLFQKDMIEAIISGEYIKFFHEFATSENKIENFLYAVLLNGNVIKIGKSINPKRRIQSYASINKKDISVPILDILIAEATLLKRTKSILGEPISGREYFNGGFREFKKIKQQIRICEYEINRKE